MQKKMVKICCPDTRKTLFFVIIVAKIRTATFGKKMVKKNFLKFLVDHFLNLVLTTVKKIKFALFFSQC
jgi:hypothetical protein